MPVDNRGQEDGNALDDSEAHERVRRRSSGDARRSQRQAEIDPRTDPVNQTNIAVAMEAGSAVTLPLPQEDDASLLISDDDPRQLIVSADTRESVVAVYLDRWKRRVEAVGESYLPELGALDGVTGSPTLMVRIDIGGTLLKRSFEKAAAQRFSILRTRHFASCIAVRPIPA